MSEITELIAGQTSDLGEVFGRIQAVPQSTFIATAAIDTDGQPNEPMTITLNAGLETNGAWKDITVVSGKVVLYPESEDLSPEDRAKLDGIEAGAQVNVKTDWAESNPNSDKFLENKPDQVNFNIYNQNSTNEVVVNNTVKTNIIQATTGTTTLPSYNLNDSFIGKLFGTFDNSNQASTVMFKFTIGNRTYDMAIDVSASTNILPVSIDYTINFPIYREAHFTGVVRIGVDSAVIDIQLPTSIAITGFNYMLEAELELGELRSKSSFLHRNYN